MNSRVHGQGGQKAEEQRSEQVSHHVGSHDAQALGGVDSVFLADQSQGWLAADADRGAHGLTAHAQDHSEGQADEHGSQVAELLEDQSRSGLNDLEDVGSGAGPQLHAQDQQHEHDHVLAQLDFLLAAQLF